MGAFFARNARKETNNGILFGILEGVRDFVSLAVLET